MSPEASDLRDGRSGAQPPRRSRSIRHQITLVGLALTALVLTAFAIMVVLQEVHDRRQALEANTRVSAQIISANSAAALAFRDEAEANEILASLAASPDVLRARLYLANGEALGAYESGDVAQPCHELKPSGSGWRLSWCGASLYQPSSLHGKTVGTLALEVGLRSTYEALAETVAASVAFAALAFVLSIPLWRRLAGRLAGPLVELVDLAERVGREQDFSLRSHATGMREVEKLAEGFNRMMAKLQQRDVRLTGELVQQREVAERLNDLAYLDKVTGLHNRHYFGERLDAAIARASSEEGSCALLYIDLDGFKKVNDTLGHDAGDELLRQVGGRLTEALRKSDGVCRLGGDEFAVIVDGNVGPERLEAIAAKLVQAVAAPYLLDGRDARVSASIGGCLFPAQAPDRESLVRHADAAMYRAKQSGKNRFHIHAPAACAASPRPEPQRERASEVAGQ